MSPSGEDKSRKKNLNEEMNLVVGASGDNDIITARLAGGLVDMHLPVSVKEVELDVALENLAKAINLALQADFLETELEPVYKVASVTEGRVEIEHEDYIGLGDGFFASIGKVTRSLQLTLQGPDPASPAGKDFLEKHGSRPISGFFNLIGRKLNLLQEYEDMVPTFVEQMLDRLEATRVIRGWSRQQWDISTDTIGLTVRIEPNPDGTGKSAKPKRRKR